MKLLPLPPCPLLTLSPCLQPNSHSPRRDTIAPGVPDFSHIPACPREVEIELTGRRLVNPPGNVPTLIREARGELDPAHWEALVREKCLPG